jgi:hypothetical protein
MAAGSAVGYRSRRMSEGEPTGRPRPPEDTANATPPAVDGGAPGPAAPSGPPRRRPILERIGMAGIALVLAALFGAVAAAAFGGGEPFLAAMAAVGCLMTVWVGAQTLLRG